MNRIQLACLSLIASAFLMAGLLVVQLGSNGQSIGLNSPAYGSGQVIARDNFTLLTARTRENEDSLFVLESTVGRLLVYRLDATRNRLEVAGGANLADVFQIPRGGNDEDEAPGRRGR